MKVNRNSLNHVLELFSTFPKVFNNLFKQYAVMCASLRGRLRSTSVHANTERGDFPGEPGGQRPLVTDTGNKVHSITERNIKRIKVNQQNDMKKSTTSRLEH